MDAVEAHKQLASAYSLISLRTVKVTVPLEIDNPRNVVGLKKLHRFLIAPVIKSRVRYSLFLVRCLEHNTTSHRVEDISMTGFRRLIPTLAKSGQGVVLEECPECLERIKRLRPPIYENARSSSPSRARRRRVSPVYTSSESEYHE